MGWITKYNEMNALLSDKEHLLLLHHCTHLLSCTTLATMLFHDLCKLTNLKVQFLSSL